MSEVPANGHKIYKRLLLYASRYWRGFAVGLLATAISSGMNAGYAWLIKPLLDKGFIERDSHFIHWLPIILIVAFTISNVTGFVSSYFMAWVGRNVVNSFRKDLFAKYMQLPASYLDNTTSGQLLSKLIFNVEQVAKASTDSIVTVVQEGCFIAGLIVVMFINSWQLSVMFVLAAPFISLVARKSSKRMRRLSQNVQNSMSGVTQITEEGLDGYRVIRTFGAENYEITRFNELAEKNRQREMKTIATNALASGTVQMIAAVVIAATVYLATAKITHITAGTFVSIITAMLAMLKPMKNLTNVNNIIQKGIAGAESIFAVLDEAPEPDYGTQHLKRAKGGVSFKQVNFAYQSTQKAVLHDIQFQIAPGQTVALVGKSGSGKSTLVSLLPRFYDNYSGTICIDDIDIRELTLADLRAQLGMVSQHVVLFNDTIANNISYGRLGDVSEKEIIAAAEAANVMEFVQNLPQGLQTLIGENGVLLSGGQRQRIAIARALLKNAPILILDEATSSLDTESERHIQAALERLMRTRTTLVIAHRLSTIENADNIMVLDAGRIVESGKHKDLLALNGYYARLHQHQFKDE